MLTLQPEEISYTLGTDDLEQYITQDPDNPEGEHWSILTVGDAVYNNIPFTYDRNNCEITSLSVNIKDVVESSSSNMAENSHKEIILHYYAMDVTDIPTVGEFIDVEISNPVTVDYGERVGETTDYKEYAVIGNYLVKEITYKNTIVYEETVKYYDVEIVLAEYNDSASSEEEEDDDVTDTVEEFIETLSPIDRDIPVTLILDGQLIFSGKLVDINKSSLKAMGSEIYLAEKIISTPVYYGLRYLVNNDAGGMSYEWVNTVEDVATLLLREHYTAPSSSLFALDMGDNDFNRSFHNTNFDSFVLVDQSVWQILVSIANTYGYFLTVVDGTVHLHAEARRANNGGMAIAQNLPESMIEDRTITYNATKSYDGVEITGNLSLLRANVGVSSVIIKCYNQLYVAGQATDYSTGLPVDTDEPAATSTSFKFVISDEAVDGMGLSASEGNIDYVNFPSSLESTLSEYGLTTSDYAKTITVSVRPELLTVIRQEPTSEDAEAVWRYSGVPVSVQNVQPSYVYSDHDVYFDVIPSGNGGSSNDTPGEFRVNIFGAYDSLLYFEIVVPVKDPGGEFSTILLGYYRKGGTSNVYSHNASMMQGQSNGTIDALADYILEKENAKLTTITLSLTGYVDTKPGDIISYSYQGGMYTLVVERVSVSLDQNREISSTLEGYSYEPLTA